MKRVALIPAYNPDDNLLKIVSDLTTLAFDPIIVVNDGSKAGCGKIFEQLNSFDQVVVLHHAVNLGKGAALKSGLNYFLLNFGDEVGVVTADADGQHLPKNILEVSHELRTHPECLILGSRTFAGKVPWKSLLGNRITTSIFWFLTGQKIIDTQTGLRGIPTRFMARLLRVRSSTYEFELEMLLLAQSANIGLRTVPISTVYINNNSSSHFNPLVDSMKIYFVFIRSVFSSMFVAFLDYLVFLAIFSRTQEVFLSMLCSRTIAIFVSFALAKRVVFRYKLGGLNTFLRYVMLVAAMGFVSYHLIQGMNQYLGISVLFGKLIAEGLLYLGSFAIQRDFIFSQRGQVKDA